MIKFLHTADIRLGKIYRTSADEADDVGREEVAEHCGMINLH